MALPCKYPRVYRFVDRLFFSAMADGAAVIDKTLGVLAPSGRCVIMPAVSFAARGVKP